MQVTHSFRLVFDCALVDGDLEEVLAKHYGIETWSDAPRDVYMEMDDPTYAWGELHTLRALEKDIEAGTVWEPPKDLLYYSHVHNPAEMPTFPSALGVSTIKSYEEYFPYINEALRAKIIADMHTEINKTTTFINCTMQVAQAPKKGDFWYMGKLMASSHDWHHDGNNWACLVCGSAFDPMTPDCLGLTLPSWDTEPVKMPWKHGLCLTCQCELSPAMDGDGATKCKGCNR